MSISEAPALNIHVNRIRGEYMEMPGLRLSLAQAQRLWGMDAESCTIVLQLLIDASFLRRTPNGEYLRVTDGSAAPSRCRMASASLTSPARLKTAG